MLADSKRITKILKKYEIDIYQFWALYLRCINDYDSLNHYDEKYNFIPLTRVKQLVDKNLIKSLGNISENGVEKITFLDIHVTEQCIETFFKDCDIVVPEMGNELISIFPAYVEVNGKKIPSKGGGDVNGIYYDKDNFASIYLSKINYSEEIHNKIIIYTHKAKELGLLNCTLRNYIHNRQWEEFFEIIDLENSKIDYNKVKTI